MSHSILRKQHHDEVKVLMGKGDLSSAISEATRVVDQLGPHLGLLCDLAACQYEVGSHDSCRATLLRIEAELKACEGVVSNTSAIKTLLFVSKLREEFGDFSEAVELLRAAKKYEPESSLRYLLYSHELRLLSSIGQTEFLATTFAQLAELNLENENQKIEVFHSMMWAEWALFGTHQKTHFWNQLKQFKLTPSDARTISRDLLEMQLISPALCSEALNEAVQVLKDSGPSSYDRFLIELYETGFGNLEFFYCADSSKTQKIRILMLTCFYCKDEDTLRSYRSRLRFFLASAGTESRRMIEAFMAKYGNLSQQAIYLDGPNLFFEIGGNQVPATVRQMELLGLYLTQNSVSLEQLAKSIWNEDFNQQHYDRIRMMVAQLNKLIEKTVGRKAFIFTKKFVRLDRSFFATSAIACNTDNIRAQK